jgi:predicted transposase YbfD/YdcC
LADEADGADGQTPVHLAIDGKTLRGSHDRRHDLGPLHLVSVWATQQGVTLGQVATEAKSNEITAIPVLLDQLDLENAVVTIDAAGCQKSIAAKIVDGGGDYVLALKDNQPTLYRAVCDWFEERLEDDFAGVPVSRWEEHETGHGRVEHRYYFQVRVPDDLPGRTAWAGLKTIGMAIRTSQRDGQETGEIRYYISTLRRHGQRFAGLVRGHWGIENTLHWSLDMTFREDASRVRARRLAENLAWLRRLALTLIKQHPGKESLVGKRRMAAWSVDFLMQVLAVRRI